MKLTNSTTGVIIDLSFSHDGTRLVGLSDVADHKVMMWDTVTGKEIFCVDLPASFKAVVVNPGESTNFALYGDEGLYIGYITEIMGESNVRFEKLELFLDAKAVEDTSGEVEEEVETDEITAISQSNCVGFACWAPNNILYVGTGQGCLLFANTNTKTVKVIAYMTDYHHDRDMSASNLSGANIATCGILTPNNLIVGT